MPDLRKKLIRLAHQKPELRADLLPLIQKQSARSEHYALTDVRVNEVDRVRIALEEAGYKTRPYQQNFYGHSVAMIEVWGDPRGIAKVMWPWIKRGDVQRVSGNVEDHFKRASKRHTARGPAPIEQIYLMKPSTGDVVRLSDEIVADLYRSGLEASSFDAYDGNGIRQEYVRVEGDPLEIKKAMNFYRRQVKLVGKAPRMASKLWSGSFKYPLGDMLPVDAEDLEQELRLLLARKWNVDVKVVSDFRSGGYGLRITDTTKTLDGLAKKIADGLYQDTVKTLKSIGKAISVNMRVVQRENVELIKAAQRFR